MVARARRHNESFEKYRKNLKEEAKDEQFRTSYRFRRHLGVIAKMLPKNVQRMMHKISNKVPKHFDKAKNRAINKAQRTARRGNR